MKYTFSYTITELNCPTCGTVLKKSDDRWISIICICLFPLLILALPYYISYKILKEKVFKIETPFEYIGEPKIKICPSCGTRIKASDKINYDRLNIKAKTEYDNRHWFRAAYFSGGSLIYCIPFSLTVISSHTTDKIIGTAFLCLIPLFLLAITCIICRYKKILLSIKEKQENSETIHHISDKLKEYKELLDSEIITKEEFEALKKQLLGL